MYANHPEMAKRWEAETPAGPLPERVGDKKRKQPKSKQDWADMLYSGNK